LWFVDGGDWLRKEGTVIQQNTAVTRGVRMRSGGVVAFGAASELAMGDGVGKGVCGGEAAKGVVAGDGLWLKRTD